MMRSSRHGPKLHALFMHVAGAVRGLTLIEVLVVTSLLALVAGALVPVLTTTEQTWRHARRRVELIQNARIALDHLADRLRAAQTFQVVSATNIRFTYFYGDATTIPTNEYRLNATTNELEYRWDPDPFLPLAGPFRSMSVACFGDSGATIACTSVASVRSVQVSLVVCEAAPSGACRPLGDPETEVPDFTVSTRAFRQVP